MKKRNLKKNKKAVIKEKKRGVFALPRETKQRIFGVLMFLVALIITLAFFGRAGAAGRIFMKGFTFLIGKVIFAFPLLFILGGLAFFISKYKSKSQILLAIFILVLGITGILGVLSIHGNTEILSGGGWLGYLIGWPLMKFFGFWVSQIIFWAVIIIGCLIFWQIFKQPKPSLEPAISEKVSPEEKPPSLIKKIFAPKFQVKEIPPLAPQEAGQVEPKPSLLKLKTKPVETGIKITKYQYQPPPLDLLDSERESPTSGDTRVNSAIIKKTLQNFDIQVEMSEVNIGPTVTQYTLKPAEGVKLSKITGLSNDLSLALASHPIRIEAPIPGRSLVGVEVPNKIRARVRLKNFIGDSNFRSSSSNLTIILGEDVSGNSVFADLARMPHLLVAGSTGTGKTIFLNSLILSLLYQNSPEILRFILVDPKRVEFPVYNELPHLLCPVVYNAQKAVNALKWLIGEMERRFDVLSESRARDITSYNETIAANLQPETSNPKPNIENLEPMPYIVLIIDELADLMAAKGREIEAGIVRLAQMARAVGIHLVVATQRPSVEVITGLIKANITSRITFQVASQVDSRTVLDMAGAEKLLGLGDMLFVSAEIVKPRRIQGAFISDKEVRKVVKWIKSKVKSQKHEIEEGILENKLAENLERTLEAPESESESFYSEKDPLYEEAKKVVIEARKASASLLQRRLRIGYARAARLIDMLEEREVVGPGEGAKPREVYIKTEEEDEGWQKV